MLMVQERSSVVSPARPGAVQHCPVLALQSTRPCGVPLSPVVMLDESLLTSSTSGVPVRRPSSRLHCQVCLFLEGWRVRPWHLGLPANNSHVPGQRILFLLILKCVRVRRYLQNEALSDTS